MHCSNVQAQSAEEYFRITIYNEFLPHVISELQSRFVDNASHNVGILHLLPSKCCNTSEDADIPEKLKIDFYTHDLPNAILFPTEYRMWVTKWSQHGPGPENVLSACDSTSFPNIHGLLQLALTLPITSCESERSFSQLKLIKMPHRSTMTSRRLSGLVLMKINCDICETLHSPSRMKERVQLFKEQYPRRIISTS